jgi:hypothetical protein
MNPAISPVQWPKTYRAINSCYPPCNIWEDVLRHSEDWKLAFELEAMTNPRVRQEVGDISLIPEARMVKGQHSWWLISAFTHPRPGRFSDGSFGVYYAANQQITALKEKAYWVARFMDNTDEPHISTQVRILVGSADCKLHDIREKTAWESFYYLDDYRESQALAVRLRDANSDGIVYQSVRDEGGECIAIFWPDVLPIPLQGDHISFHWDGNGTMSYYDDKAGWVTLISISG